MLKPIQGRTMCAEMVGDLLLVVHSPSEPAADEWSAYCAYAGTTRARQAGVLKTLVVTQSDAGPSARQRAEYKDKVAGNGNQIAVLCAGNVTRAILTAMSWFNRDMKAFGIDEFEPACRYLGHAWSPDLVSRARQLQRQLQSTRQSTG